MQTLKRGLMATFLLFSPLVQADGLQDQLNTFFAQKLAGFSDEVVVTVRTPPNLYPSCEQPSFTVTGTTRLWGNVNVLARCANEKRYLQVAVQATGNYVVAAVPIARGTALQANSVTLKRGRLDQLPPRTMLEINQAQDAVSLRDVAPGQPMTAGPPPAAWRPPPPSRYSCRCCARRGASRRVNRCWWWPMEMASVSTVKGKR